MNGRDEYPLRVHLTYVGPDPDSTAARVAETLEKYINKGRTRDAKDNKEVDTGKEKAKDTPEV